jgi:hypothetical protein
MSEITRPNYAAGFELDGPYHPSTAQRLRDLLANLMHWIKP